MRRFVIPCLLGVCVSLVAGCSGSKGDDDDDDNGGDGSSGGTAGTGGASGGTGGTSATGGTGGSTTGGTAGTGGTGGTGGSSGSGSTFLPGGPFAFPQNKKPQFCELTTVANASGAVQTAYAFWKQQFLVPASTGQLRVQRPENGNDTVSEGIGYGMIIAVYMNDRPTFDGLWAYAQFHSDMAGLMNWKITSAGAVASDGTGSATDADEDIAWALLMASGQWASSAYYDAGKKMAAAIMFNSVAGDGMLKPGDQWGSSNKTYPDYFSPAYFRVFKQVSNNSQWDIVIKRNYEILAAVSGQYGLVPDSTTGAYDLTETYKYDACRTPWRIAMDYCWYGTPEAKTYLDKIGAFFDAQGAQNIGDGYSLTGTKTSSFGNMAFVGPAGVAGMAGFPKLLNDAFTYGATGNGGTTGYYQQSLRVITMLMMSGNYVNFALP